MNFEENLLLAQEVIDFAMSSQVLRIRPVTVTPDEFGIEVDFARARRRAMGDDIWDSRKADESSPAPSLLSWQAVRSQEESKIVGANQSHPHYDIISRKVREVTEDLEEFLLETLPDEYKGYYLDATNDIDADLCACIESRLVMGTANPFFENVFRAYKAGGWPCGWEGQYPKGRIVVFVPEIVGSGDG